MAVYPHKHKNHEWWIVLVIMLVAVVFRFQHITTTPPGLYPDEAMNGHNALEAIKTGDYKVYYPENNGREGLFINIQAQSIKLFGNTPWALRVVSALFGTLTVLGLYFLTRKLFNWQIAAMSSFFLATSFWHVLFSRIGFRAIMAPFFLVWGLYFFWKGKSSTKLFDFAISGLFIGLGFYSYIAYRIVPLIIILVIWAYWHSLKRDFSHEKFIHTRNQLMRGFAMLMVAGIIVAFPLGWYYLMHTADFMGRAGQVSIFSADNPVQAFFTSTVKTLGMFNLAGDWNWRHNFAGRPELFWPVGILFLIGLIRCLIKLYRKKKSHGHFPTVQVLLISWFVLGLFPIILSNEGIPHALRAILVTPVVMIFAGEGLWWIYVFCKKWYGMRDMHDIVVHDHHLAESSVVASLAIFLFMFGVMINEYNFYFNRWAPNDNVAQAFDEESTSLGELINSMPRDQLLYVYVNARGVLVRGIPMPAQTVMFITDSWTAEKQVEKNIFYLTEEAYSKGLYQKDAVVIPLLP